MIGYIYRFFQSRPRLLLGFATMVVVYFGLSTLVGLLPKDWTLAVAYDKLKFVTQFLLAWNIGIWVYLLAIFRMMYKADQHAILDKAHAEDEGTVLMLILVFVTAIVSMLAIVVELGTSKDAKGALMLFHIALTAMTILTAWLFIHTMFAIHYTHEYFLLKEEKNTEMLDFPNDDDPAYWDFLYFSYIIGTSGQTADVAFNTQQSRIIGTIHCVLSFFFNTAILASLINMSAGLIG
ncbi:MAG: DUF1345 domain-containing protein [Gammaproteobacteria bacterium]|nr:DUF1345 domain-containing protein [Moraxella sp. CTOTU47579]NOX78631.1 DUF1345 domain-containing protein [Gammaproteobacteria bacterium]NPA79404.1 DUF1345 domain-containing protein [Gammaproteobacteria bacterium]